MTTQPTVTIPLELANELIEVLGARMFISVDEGNDEDNDYEVINVRKKLLEEIERQK